MSIKQKIVFKIKSFICFFKREGKETYIAAKIFIKISKGKEVTPEQISFLKSQSIDIGKVLALIGLQAVPGSSVALIALEKFGKKHGFTIFPKDQIEPPTDEFKP